MKNKGDELSYYVFYTQRQHSNGPKFFTYFQKLFKDCTYHLNKTRNFFNF